MIILNAKGETIIQKLRWWLIRKLIGKTPYISGVTFYQTIALDARAKVVCGNVTVDLNHDKRWRGKDEMVAMCVDYYADSAESEGEDNA